MYLPTKDQLLLKIDSRVQCPCVGLPLLGWQRSGLLTWTAYNSTTVPSRPKANIWRSNLWNVVCIYHSRRHLKICVAGPPSWNPRRRQPGSYNFWSPPQKLTYGCTPQVYKIWCFPEKVNDTMDHIFGLRPMSHLRFLLQRKSRESYRANQIASVTWRLERVSRGRATLFLCCSLCYFAIIITENRLFGMAAMHAGFT